MKSKKIMNPQAEKTINYKFKNKNLLSQAFTHSSYAYENNLSTLKNNERLEFLGDAILQIVMSEYLYHKFPKMSEGELTRLRASVVCEPTLAMASRDIGLGKYLIIGRGEERMCGRERDSILGDVFEAIVASIYLDGGIEPAKVFILNALASYAENLSLHLATQDYKTRLQELIQKDSQSPLKYITVDEQGPDHEKVFTVQLKHKNRILGEGIGKSKKDAEQQAAKIAIQKLSLG